MLDESRYRAPSALDAAAQARDPVGNEFYRRSWFLYTPSLWGRGTVLNADPDVGDLSRADALKSRGKDAIRLMMGLGEAIFGWLAQALHRAKPRKAGDRNSRIAVRPIPARSSGTRLK